MFVHVCVCFRMHAYLMLTCSYVFCLFECVGVACVGCLYACVCLCMMCECVVFFRVCFLCVYGCVCVCMFV